MLKTREVMLFHNKYKAMAGAICCLALYFAGCQAGGDFPGREYMPDMAHSKAYETYSPSPRLGGEDGEKLFKDNLSARLPVAGTIPRGYSPYPFANTNEGYEQAGLELYNPVKPPYDANMLKKAKTNYATYCAVCHGDKGDGQGVLVQNGVFPGVPTYFEDLMKLPEGKMFHTVQYGRNLMGSYAPQLSKEERWQVIAYIKTLQAKKAAQTLGISEEEALKILTGVNTYDGENTPLGKSDAAKLYEIAVDFSKQFESLKTNPLQSGQRLALNNVLFETGSAKLKAESHAELDNLAQVLESNPDIQVEISGHTDNTGTEETNLKLSNERAKTVFDYLVARGAHGENLSYKGYGSSRPVAANDTEEGRTLNRRTEFEVK